MPDRRPGGPRRDGPGGPGGPGGRRDGPRPGGPRPGRPRWDPERRPDPSGPDRRATGGPGPRRDGPRFDAPRRDGPPWERPPTDRPPGDRPGGDRSWRPAGGDRPDGTRFRPGGPRPDGPRPGGPRRDGPRRDGPPPWNPGAPRPYGPPGGASGAYGGPPRGAPLPPPAALAEGEELVAGRRPVEEAFLARRPARRLLVVPQRRSALEKLVLHATNLRIPIVEVEGGSLTALAGFDGHQGIALVVEPRIFAGIDDVLARATERGEAPFVLVLDSLEDPHNVGSLLRSAEAAGVHGVLFPTHRQAPLSPSAVKASAGAIEHLLLCPVDDLPGALSDLHARGLRIAGADGSAPLTARQSDLRGPLAIVVGSEGQGLGPAVRRRCDLFMRIPMRGNVGSLNAAVAGSILLFEAVAQREVPSGGDDQPTTEPTSRVSPAERAVRARPAKPRKSAEPVDAAMEADEDDIGEGLLPLDGPT
ncbi:MAG: 23S rRNA (guanosine(2251)-2'-O)-methyltransferase RlmB [Chloroflexota bacterium]